MQIIHLNLLHRMQIIHLNLLHIFIAGYDSIIMIRRKVYDSLLEWKGRPDHKCLVIKGQRQVGKTFIINEFSKEYEYSVYVDLSRSRPIRELFEREDGVDNLVFGLSSLIDGSVILPERTLIILDEIQSCPRAKASLKDFTIDGRYHVIASGSLLDIPMANGEDPKALIPVGFVEEIRMYSLDYEEFLWAKGVNEGTVSHVKDCIRNRTPIKESVLEHLNDIFREYMLIGGMPEAVSRFIEGEGLVGVRAALDTIISQNRNDVSKYCKPPLSEKVRTCMDSIPSQLSESNKKFMYSRLDDNGSRSGSRKYEGALDWIVDSGIGNPCYQLLGISYPLTDEDRKQFRMYVSDTGLLVRMYDSATDGSPMSRALITGDHRFNQGVLMENVVAECLMKSGLRRRYYLHRKEPGRMELDFVLEIGSDIVAIEVKSGKDREVASLSKTIGDDRFQRRVMLEWTNVRIDDEGVEHYPLFAAAFLKETCTERSVDDLFMELERKVSMSGSGI